MEITLLIKSVMGLVVVLAILMFLLFLPSRQKLQKVKEKAKKQIAKKNALYTDLNSLVTIIKKKDTPTQELQETMDLIIKYHGKIHAKLGIRVHPDFDIYMDILFTICRHPHADKNIVLKFDKELTKLNPTYTKEINDAITKGLNSRRV
ncbi:MAG: hypothetical protein U9N33_06790 [Campylobacterota bacterium]|nr:hypothetical protein [Campylobacterota bacterium]